MLYTISSASFISLDRLVSFSEPISLPDSEIDIRDVDERGWSSDVLGICVVSVIVDKVRSCFRLLSAASCILRSAQVLKVCESQDVVVSA